MGVQVRDYRNAKSINSPWSVSDRIKMLLWEFVWKILCSWTPKPFNRWRLWWLKVFGANVSGLPFVHQRARIQIPWNVILRDGACIGDRANIYSLAIVELGENVVIAQEAYLCTGTHRFRERGLPLEVAAIHVGKGAFVGARAFVLPGVTIGEGAIVGACSVVTRDIREHSVNAGNPSRIISDESHLQSHNV